MKLILLVVAMMALGAAFRAPHSAARSKIWSATQLRMSDGGDKDPLLLRAARGEDVERVPVWMMRQAGRHMQVSGFGREMSWARLDLLVTAMF